MTLIKYVLDYTMLAVLAVLAMLLFLFLYAVGSLILSAIRDSYRTSRRMKEAWRKHGN